jgi:hypothetical protein
LEPRPSSRLILSVGAIHAAVFGFSIWAPLPDVPRPMLFLPVLAGYLLFLRRHVWRPVTMLAWDPVGGWSLGTVRGGEMEARLRHDAFVHPSLIVLNFSLGRWRRRSVVLLPDSLPADELRRLRALLRDPHSFLQPMGTGKKSFDP